MFNFTNCFTIKLTKYAVQFANYGNFLSAERLLFSIPRANWKTDFVPAYKEFIEKDNPPIDAFYFHYKTFGKFNKETMSSVIDIGFKRLIELDSQSMRVFQRWLELYWDYKVDYDPRTVLNQLEIVTVKPNFEILSNLMKKFAQNGDVIGTKDILQMMIHRSFFIKDTTYFYIYHALIRSGDIATADAFLREHNLETNSNVLLWTAATAYAENGNIGKVVEHLDQLPQAVPDLYTGPHSNNCAVFFAAAHFQMPLKQLKLLLPYVRTERQSRVKQCIFRLNSVSLYQSALLLLPVYQDNYNALEAVDIIFSFNNPDCPLEIYEEVLTCLSSQTKAHHMNTIFCYQNFDVAMELSSRLVKPTNAAVMLNGLALRALQDEDNGEASDGVVKRLEQVVLWSRRCKIKLSMLNNLLIRLVIPELLHRGLVNSHLHLISLMPGQRNLLVPVCCMHLLLEANWDEYEALASKFVFRQQLVLGYDLALYHIDRNFLNGKDNPINRLERLFSRLRLKFEPSTSEPIMQKTVALLIRRAAQTDDQSALLEVITLAQKYDIFLEPEYHKEDLKLSEKYRDLFQSILKKSSSKVM